jgi:hypothetical protein
MTTDWTVYTTDPGPDPVTGIDPWPTTQNAINNATIQANSQVALYNKNLFIVYMNAFSSWAQSVLNGKIDNSNPPQPPMAWEVVTDSSTGLSNVLVSANPVCALPPIPASHIPVTPVLTPNTAAVGIQNSGNPGWFVCLPNDTIPNGECTPQGTKSADGVVGIFRKFSNPFGSIYEKVG